ncbi:O-antigen ligase family protein [Gordonia tangerina]|uniref:O-antigen ligase family protein n=1 Tax=Gordonia tangerina TaxID=2911060 RepID=A0ABS9DQR1_9ACTN|nr:O-antigen ligase family protein [Gordonia tangerina]MCF3940143.1 O-antigen ligase family protein [Gordonia tangerina]
MHSVRPATQNLLPIGAAIVAGISVAVAVVLATSQGSADLLAFAALVLVAVALIGLGLHSPRVAVVYLLFTTFFRLALTPYFPVDPFLIAFAGLVTSYLIWLSVRPHALPRLGWLEGFMVLYFLWNVYSMFAPHELGAVYPLSGETLSVYRFILTGTLMPFTMYLIGRSIYDTERAVRVLLWSVSVFSLYCAAVSILQFRAPGLVWPRYIVEAPNWPGRANGVFNQPVVNGLTLIAGFVATLILIEMSPRLPRWAKVVTGCSAAAMAYAIYLTHTRAIWLAFLVVVVVGVAFGHRIRRGFSVTLLVMVGGALANWTAFTSSDRSAGGVASTNEVDDRLNSMATSFWAAGREPWFGWGIGRFTAVNTVHHQQYSQDVPWARGYGISSHFNELGILVELGLVGLVLWLAVLVLLLVKLVRAVRVSPPDSLCGRNLALLAAMMLGVLIIAGFTVDLRFFDFPTILVYLLAGVAVGCAERANPPSAQTSTPAPTKSTDHPPMRVTTDVPT